MSSGTHLSLLREQQAIILEIVSFMKYGSADDEDDPDFDPDFDAGYEQAQVDRCEAILSGFVTAMHQHRGAEPPTLLDEVKSTVEALNQLNHQCDGCMLETDQRESICALIDNGLRYAGFHGDGDVTRPWREW